MDYKIKPIRTYEDYLTTASDRIYLTADALMEECEASEGGCTTDRENVIPSMMNEWEGSKKRLADSPLFDSLAKFEIEIDNIEEPRSDQVVDGITNWFSNTYPRMKPTFVNTENYDRFLTEKALQLPSEGGKVELKTFNGESNELEVLVRKLLYIMDIGYNNLINVGKRMGLEEGVVTPFMAPEYTLAVYKILYQAGIYHKDSDYFNIYDYLYKANCSPLHHFGKTYHTNEVCVLPSNNSDDLATVGPEVTLLDVGDSNSEVLRDHYLTESDVISGGWRLSAELDDTNKVLALWWQGLNGGISVDNGHYLGYRKPVKDLNLNIELFNEIYTTMMQALIAYTPVELKDILQPFFSKAFQDIHDDKVVFAEYEEELSVTSREMLWFQAIVLEFIVVASEEEDYLVWLNGSLSSRKIFELPTVTVSQVLAEKLNRASTLNKQLQMLLREFLQQKWSVLGGFKGDHNKDFHFRPVYPARVTGPLFDEMPENHEELRIAAVEELRQSKLWAKMRETIQKGTSSAMKAVLSVVKRKKVLRQSRLLGDVNDSLKIKNAGRYLLPEKSTWVVSLEVPDILTASINNNDWSSCHAGSYANSPMVYGANQTTFIVYQKGSSSAYISPDVDVDSKVARAYVHYVYDSQGGTFIIEDAYPCSNRVVTEILPTIFAEMAGINSRRIEPFQFDPEDISDMIITGYFDCIETDTSVMVGDFDIHPGDVFSVYVPPFSEDGYLEEWFYGDYGCVDAYANW